MKMSNIRRALLNGSITQRGLHVVGRVVEKSRRRHENGTSARCKVGTEFVFSSAGYQGGRRAAAPYRQAAPVVDGVRMRWENGRLVPRR